MKQVDLLKQSQYLLFQGVSGLPILEAAPVLHSVGAQKDYRKLGDQAGASLRNQ